MWHTVMPPSNNGLCLLELTAAGDALDRAAPDRSSKPNSGPIPTKQRNDIEKLVAVTWCCPESRRISAGRHAN